MLNRWLISSYAEACNAMDAGAALTPLDALMVVTLTASDNFPIVDYTVTIASLT